MIASLVESCYTAAILIPWALAALGSWFSPCRFKARGAEKVSEEYLLGTPAGGPDEDVLPSFFAGHHRRLARAMRATKKGCNHIMIAALNTFAGAEEKTRTFTGKPQLDPEPSASTNSATSATRMNMLPVRLFVKTFLTRAVKKHTVRLL